MKRDELIKKLKQYFKIEELVCPHVYNKYREEQMWSFFSMAALETLLVLREYIIQKPFIINNWKSGGSYSQRGLRCNICAIPKEKTNLEKVYMSAHCTGEAYDITVQGMSAEEAHQLIIKNKDNLPYPIRLEDGVSWLHVDTYDMGNGKKITLFRV